MSGIIELVAVILLAVAFAWLSVRAWRLRHPFLRFIGGLLGSLLTLVLVAVSVVGLLGAYKLYTPHAGPAPSISARGTPEQLAAAGRRASGCAGCHGSRGELPLDGGNDNFLSGPPGGPPPLGVLVPPNLTPAGPLKDWTDGEIARAIREGLDRNGHALVIMPSEAFHHLSDEDVSMLVAYLRSQPAVEHPTPSRDLSLLVLLLVGGGAFPTAEQPAILQPQTAPPPGVTPAYGKYLVDITGCAGCHGEGLVGRSPGGFGPPAGPNLKVLVPTWQEAAFVSFFRTGVDPYGRTIDATAMPWKDIGKSYQDDELRAMYAYIRSL